MTLEIPEGTTINVDRDGTANCAPRHVRQGFDVDIDHLRLHFKDEQDAENMAKAILARLGHDL